MGDPPVGHNTDSITVINPTDLDLPPSEGEPLAVLVLCKNFIATYALPESGEVTVGRSHCVEIHVEDPLVSRRHAIVSMTPRPTIRDLGSSNGTVVQGVRLAPGEARELAVGDVVNVGTAALLIQQGARAVNPRRFWPEQEFIARINEECARVERSGRGFAVGCLAFARNVPEVKVRQRLAATLRMSDLAGAYGPSSYALLFDATTEQARAALDRIVADLASHDLEATSGIAEFGSDGKTAEELLAAARPVARQRSVPAGDDRAVIVDPKMKELFKLAERIAAGDISVLIVGETGVGKEVMAEEIHRRSRRASRPFVRLNCGALSETLLESELFGHERGAFTSALAVKPGLLETADGGVVLLDEVGEIPMMLQVKLLRVLEEKQVRRLGGIKSRPLDVRFIAATNRDLEKQAARGLFRQDLYYRLAGATVKIPPLRERPGDIEALARSFLAHASRHLGVPATLSPEALAVLRAHSWPGNVRELKHAIERAMLLAGSAPITPAHLLIEQAHEDDDDATDVTEAKAGDASREHILEVLAACGGNQSRAAKQLGISRGALIRRLDRFGIVRPRRPE